MSTPTAQQLILVLGMHRSGTSACARALRVFGISLGGELLPAHPCNPKGFFEDERVYAFNRALLARLGRVWHSPGTPDATVLRRLAVGAEGQEALALLRAKTAGRAVFGLKDPRMSTLMPFWRPVLAAGGFAARCLICLRHPAGVAHSLLRRDGMETGHSHALWVAHTLGAWSGSAGLPRAVVDFDALLRAPEAALHGLSRFLGREANPDERTVFLTDFLDKNLCHHSAESRAAPSSAPDAHEALALEMYAALRPVEAAAPANPDGPAAARRIGAWLARARTLPPPAGGFCGTLERPMVP